MTVRIHVGDARDVLRGVDADSVHCVVTSPPYWGLRAYKGDPGMIGMEPTFEAHVENLVAVFEEVRRVLRPDGTLWLNYGDAYWSNPSNGRGAAGSALGGGEPHLSGAERKGKWLKPKDLMLMPARVAMALQEAGWWLRSEIIWHKPNPMPESVTDRPTCAHEKVFLFSKEPRYFYDAEEVRTPISEGTKERFGPAGATTFRNADAYQTTPKDVDGRSARMGSQRRMTADEDYLGVAPGSSRRPPKGGQAEWDASGKAGAANLRNVWRIPTAPYKDAHFATFPPAIVEPCIRAGTSKHGVCSECGAPWRRVVEQSGGGETYGLNMTRAQSVRALEIFRDAGLTPAHVDAIRSVGITDTPSGQIQNGAGRNIESVKELAAEAKAVLKGYWREFHTTVETTTGWQPSCECNAETVPAVVLDCFGGAGTVGLVADRLQRDAVLIEISGDYAGMARKRIEKDAGMFASIASRMTAKGKG